MRLTTKDFIVFLIGVVVSILLIMGYHHFIEDRTSSINLNNTVVKVAADTTKPSKQPTRGNGKGDSKQVYWKNLVDNLNEYLNYDKAALVQYVNEKGVTVVDTLEAFVFTASQLEDLIKHNKPGPNPDQVLFYLGKKGEFQYNGQTYGNMTLTAIGMKNGKLCSARSMPLTAAPDESIYDQADPSPPFGPLDAASFVSKEVPKVKK